MVAQLVLWPLLLPVAAASGWWMGRNNASSTSKSNAKLSRQYYVGLNYLLNEQPDKAVDVFVKLLEVDGDTVETHLALGSLFRRRGEVDRAIRIHQNLIARPQLSQQDRVEALLALGRDYMSAGVLDRAERIFGEVVDAGGEYTNAGLKYLLEIYQQEKAWDKAIAAAKKLQMTSSENLHGVIAHHYCELCEDALKRHEIDTAKRHLKKARSTDCDSVRASLLKARLEEAQGNYKKAIAAYQRIKDQDPDFLSEAIAPLVSCYTKLGNADACIDYLQETLKQHPRIAIVLILADRIRQRDGADAAASFVADYLRQHPSIRGLNKLIEWHLSTANEVVKDKLKVLQDLTEKLLEDKPIYRCGNCGFSGKNLHWQCPGCKQWSRVKPIHGLEGD